ncbi:hypothetical protein RIF29_22123 [Crotalaria pallida]|uniref:RNase H type-1 domain-containing protein n=1 Tax=Crotalaria pallida TaxID=3830 RepID=A0AAN9F436_CROPI
MELGVSGDDVPLFHHYSIIMQIKELVTRGWKVSLHHTLREGNFCGDYFAIDAIGINKFMLFQTTPVKFSRLFLANAISIQFSRV